MSEQALVKTQEPKLQTIKRNGRDIVTAKGPDGKFVAKTKVSLKEVTRKTQDFLNTKAEGKDKTRLEEMHEALFEAVLKAKDDPSCLLAAVKTVETLDKMAHGSKTRDRMMEASDPDTNKVRVIVITAPTLMNEAPRPEIKTPTKPSFADERKELPTLEAEIVQQN